MSGRWWVILTSSFAHHHPVHLLLNMEALWYIGRMFVSFFGSSAFVRTWLASAIAGSLGSLYWERSQERDNMSLTGGSLGSSAVLCGLMFALCTLRLSTLLKAHLLSIRIFALTNCALISGFSVYCLYSGFLPWICHAGHLGGMAGGVAAYCVPPPDVSSVNITIDSTLMSTVEHHD